MTSDLATLNRGIEMQPGIWLHEFRNARAFLQALHPLSEFWPQGETWIFRGHADADWFLHPAAHRARQWEPFTSIHATTFDPTKASEINRSRREMQLVREFFSAVDDAGLSVPDFARLRDLLDPLRPTSNHTSRVYWPEPELVPILALAQHYGLPTRLLDWSRFGRVAAYFSALSEAPGASHLAVWALQVPKLAELRMTSGKALWDVASAPRSSNPNLHAQSGLFTFCHWWIDEIVPLDELVSAGLANFKNMTQQHDATACLMRKMVLPRQAANDLMRLLHIEGVSALTLFPGFAGAAKHVQERLSCSLVDPPAFSEG